MNEIDQIIRRVIESDDDDDYKEIASPGVEGEILQLMNSGNLDLNLKVTRHGHYVHQRSTAVDLDVRWNWDSADPLNEEIEQRVDAYITAMEEGLTERMVDWNNKIYRELEAEWDSRLEDDYVAEEIMANERTYAEDGQDDGDIPYEQLSPEAQERAREAWKQATASDPDNYWSEHIIAEWKWLLANKGFDDIDIGWSGFSSQGDGASFTGRVDNWSKYFLGPDPLDFPEEDREQVNEAMDDDDSDFKDLLRSDRKPWGWVLKSTTVHEIGGKPWPTRNPWLNTRRQGGLGDFMQYLGDATVFKRLSTTKQWPHLEAVPIYGDPRKYGDKVLDPGFVEPPPRHSTPMPPWQDDDPIQERYGGAAKERGIWYHGTSAALIPKIMAEGLIPDPKVRAWPEDPDTSILTSTRKTVFGISLTQNFGSASLDGSRPARRDHANAAFVVVELQPRSLIADEDDVSAWVKSRGDHLSDSIYHHIWPYFMEVYRGSYRGFGRGVSEAMDDDDFDTADTKEMISHSVNDEYTAGADKQKDAWVTNALNMLLFKFQEGKAHPELVQRVRSLLVDEGYAAMLTRAVSYASKSSHDKMKWESDWREWFNRSEAPPIPDSGQAENRWQQFVEKLSRTLKNYPRAAKRKSDWAFDVSGRSEQRIGFKGANRIICIVERTDMKAPEYHSRMLVHYGQPPEKLIKDWNESVGKLGPEDIVYKNKVQEATEDSDAMPSIYVRWTWTHDVNQGTDQEPKLYTGWPYKHSSREQGPFGDWETAYEWAMANFHDSIEKMESINLISVENDVVTNAYFITRDWEMKRYGDLPGGKSIFDESVDDEDDDLKAVTGNPQRWLYLITRSEFKPHAVWIEYFATDDPEFELPKTRSGHSDYARLRDAQSSHQIMPGGVQYVPSKTKDEDIHLLAKAQIRQFQKTGEYTRNEYRNVWDWMKAMRAKPTI